MGTRIPSELRRHMVRGSLWSLVFQLFSKGAILGTTLLAARSLDVRNFGWFATLQGVAVVGAAVADFGTSMYVERELAAGHATKGLWRMAARTRTMVVMPGTLVSLALVEFQLQPEWSAEIVPFFVGALCINWSSLTNAVLQGRLQFRASALTQVGGRTIFFLATLVLSATSVLSLTSAGLAFASGEFVTLVSQLFVIRRLGSGIWTHGSNHHWRGALPYWLNSVFNLVYNRADAAIVAALAGPVQAGLYAPASSIQSALMTVPGFTTAALPNVGAHAYRNHGESTVVQMVRKSGLLAVAIGFVTAFAVSVTAWFVLPRLLGPTFTGAIAPTVVLGWSLPFYGAELALFAYLVAVGRPILTIWGYSSALVSSLVGQLLLTPSHGALGGAIASLVREPAAVAILVLVIFKYRSAASRRTETDSLPEAATGPSETFSG